MLDRPAAARPGEVALAAQQERRQPMPGAHQVRAQVLAAADQVTQLLLLLAGDPHQPQIAGREQPRQADRVALVGLDPVARAALDVSRRADRHLDPFRPGAADQAVAGRPGLIDRPHRPRQLTQHVKHFQRAAVDPARDHLPGGVVEHRHGARVRVNVQPDPTHTVRHGRRPPMCGRGRGPNPRPVELRAMRGASTNSLQQPPDDTPIGSEGSGRIPAAPTPGLALCIALHVAQPSAVRTGGAQRPVVRDPSRRGASGG